MLVNSLIINSNTNTNHSKGSPPKLRTNILRLYKKQSNSTIPLQNGEGVRRTGEDLPAKRETAGGEGENKASTPPPPNYKKKPDLNQHHTPQKNKQCFYWHNTQTEPQPYQSAYVIPACRKRGPRDASYQNQKKATTQPTAQNKNRTSAYQSAYVIPECRSRGSTR